MNRQTQCLSPETKEDKFNQSEKSAVSIVTAPDEQKIFNHERKYLFLVLFGASYSCPLV